MNQYLSETQILVAFGKYIAGYRPGDEMWTDKDQEAYEYAMDVTFLEKKEEE